MKRISKHKHEKYHSEPYQGIVTNQFLYIAVFGLTPAECFVSFNAVESL